MRLRQSSERRGAERGADRRGVDEPQADRVAPESRLTNPPVRPRRSALFVPGDRGGALAKIWTRPADVLIFDLEDAVAPDAKNLARDTVLAALASAPTTRHERIVRVNGLGTPWAEADLAALRSAPLDGILLPKVESANDLVTAATLLGRETLPFWIMIETPRGVLSAPAILGGPIRPAVMVIGTNDLTAELHARPTPDRMALLPHLATCLAAARAEGIDALDGVYNDLVDAEGFRLECEQGRDLGFDGKTLIHPAQIATANTIFAPNALELATAEAICAAFEGSDAGVLTVGGRMVERLHLAAARRTLALRAVLG